MTQTRASLETQFGPFTSGGQKNGPITALRMVATAEVLTTRLCCASPRPTRRVSMQQVNRIHSSPSAPKASAALHARARPESAIPYGETGHLWRHRQAHGLFRPSVGPALAGQNPIPIIKSLATRHGAKGINRFSGKAGSDDEKLRLLPIEGALGAF